MEHLNVATANWFSRPETQAVFACLNREDFEVRAVGGAVRNTLLGEPVREVDFATTAKPLDTTRLAARAGIKVVPTGIEHGTVTLVVGTTSFEVTTLRRDIATDGRHATVAFGEDWADDARRRDFTMNALYADAQGNVHDPLGGLSDLRARRVRFVGDAGARIREDYLRILRFFRFSAEYAEGDFDREGVSAAIKDRLGLERLSRERVRSELLRILIARRAASAIEVMDENGLLLLLLGGVVRRRRFERLCQIEAAQGRSGDPMFRLASLGLFVEEDALRLSDKLRLSSQEASDLVALAAISPEISSGSSKGQLEAFLYRLGTRHYLGRVLLAWASSGDSAEDEAWASAANLAGSWTRPKFPVSGADLIERGWKPGPALGAQLKSLEDQWISGGFVASRDELLGLAAPRGSTSEERKACPTR
jgi:poly(A) polymerase